MSEIVVGVVAIVAAALAVLYWAARNARREPDTRPRKDDGSGYVGAGGDAGDSGDCGGGDGGGD
ncbi:hypothetical protein ACIQUG_26605 [Ensifer sp. NPDC090286]|uniref:hypothetical protein n=1 Tax=Ensifer sp. NPDC090286 TaxID=3363991 RepID=UPI00383B8F27